MTLEVLSSSVFLKKKQALRFYLTLWYCRRRDAMSHPPALDTFTVEG